MVGGPTQVFGYNQRPPFVPVQDLDSCGCGQHLPSTSARSSREEEDPRRRQGSQAGRWPGKSSAARQEEGHWREGDGSWAKQGGGGRTSARAATTVPVGPSARPRSGHDSGLQVTRKLNGDIVAARNSLAILELYAARGADFNHVNICTALHRIAKHARGPHIQKDARFLNLIESAVYRLEQFRAQELANTAWAFAKMEVRNEALMAALASRAQGMLEQFNAQELANTASRKRRRRRRRRRRSAEAQPKIWRPTARRRRRRELGS